MTEQVKKILLEIPVIIDQEGQRDLLVKGVYATRNENGGIEWGFFGQIQGRDEFYPWSPESVSANFFRFPEFTSRDEVREILRSARRCRPNTVERIIL